VKRGDECEVTVERFAAEGKGVARANGYVVFVRGGVTGDHVRVRIVKAKRSFAEAEVVELLRPSDLRTAPRCKYFGVCGGCAWQHVTYDGQLTFKRQLVVDAFERIGGFENPAVRPTIGADDCYFYRNKMEFSFGVKWLTREEFARVQPASNDIPARERFALGLHVPLRFDRVLDIDECWLQSEASRKIVNEVRGFCLERELSVYSTISHEGYLRNLVIREGKHTGEVMVNIVTSDYQPAIVNELCDRLRLLFPQITTMVNNVTTRKSQVAVGEEEYVVYGPGYIAEQIGRRRYRISANSFFQTNTIQAERLYNTVREMAEVTPQDVVFDLYSGTGTIALHLADDAGAVVGIEAVESAVEDAMRNARENGVTNCTFVRGDLKDRLVDDDAWLAQHGAPRVMIIDPPRAGMHEKVVHRILQMRPQRIVYVSCNPATQARDCAILCRTGTYHLDGAQPVDMFPHTTHVENVVCLTLTGATR
jgi:23S rRNA (uracil1939-C5)-methyltransferase